jgi:hypothetical protein
MTVPHRIVCHIKLAISDRTKPDMGWRRAPLAAAYAALRQRKEARRGLGQFWAPVVSFKVPCVCVLCVVAVVQSSSQASHKLQGLQLRSGVAAGLPARPSQRETCSSAQTDARLS